MANEKIIPQQLVHIQSFTVREEWFREPGTDNWTRHENSDPVLEEQVNEWIDREGILVVGYSPPSVNHVLDTDHRRLYYLGVIFSYVKAVEGAEDAG